MGEGLKYLFDTSALISFFDGEDGAEVIKKLFEDVESGLSEGFVSVVSLTELFYIYNDKKESVRAKDVIETIIKSGLKPVPINISTSLLAGKYKSNAIPLADALIAANAVEIGAKLVTNDPHFSKTEADVLKFR